MLSVFLGFASLCAQAGYTERCTALFQALIEFNCFRPKEVCPYAPTTITISVTASTLLPSPSLQPLPPPLPHQYYHNHHHQHHNHHNDYHHVLPSVGVTLGGTGVFRGFLGERHTADRRPGTLANHILKTRVCLYCLEFYFSSKED
jgi:hypothetical protein